MTSTGDIVAKLWSMCHILRDDGVSYNEYVTELTFLLFLKMLEETKKEDRMPKAYRWVAKRDGLDQLDYYKRLLLDLGKPEVKDGLVRAIFIDAQTHLRKPTNLKAITASIDQLDWFSARARKVWATSTKVCCRKTPRTRNPARASTSRREG
jgi:type I restriction enzyme M protein